MKKQGQILQAVMEMSKYTTEVRFICESYADLRESVGLADVDVVLNKSWNKIFTTKCKFFDEQYRGVLCQKILKHYYTQEIGAETVGLWKLWMNTRLEEIMPYYNKMYESVGLEFDPLGDTKYDVTRNVNSEENKNENKNENENIGTSGSNNSSTTRDNTESSEYSTDDTKRDLYSDTPQGAITNLENETYLTNARKVIGNSGGTGSSNGTEKQTFNSTDKGTSERTRDENVTGNVNSTENYIEKVVGKRNGQSFSSMMIEYRESLVNVDLMVIDEFKYLFFGLW
jgi:hypothetical protein